MMTSSFEKVSSDINWNAKIQLSFIEKNNRTVLDQRRHKGPLQIQKPFYPEANGTCHIYILHPPGGVVGGDQYEIQIGVQSNAKVLVTTPAAGKFYRSSGQIACQVQEIRLAPQCILEWFPSENIFFSGAKAQIKTKVDLTKESHFFGWDICCLGRPASGERFTRGILDQRFEVWLQGKPVRLERLLVKENDPILDEKWGFVKKPVFGSLFCFTPRKDLVDLLRQNIHLPESSKLFSITYVGDFIICRYLGNSVEEAKGMFIKTWQILRFALLGYEAVIPRIWST